jgi:D-sedoheptulose 7-phosphate isomerase
MRYRLDGAVAKAVEAMTALARDERTLAEAARACETMAVSLKSGGKLLVCGNGGSACDAAHFAEELTGRYHADRAPIAAIACTEGGHLTCVANDFGFEQVFSRWVTALARPGDVVVVLSTSGNSTNVIRAVEAAKAKGALTVGLLGKGGGKLKGQCTHEIIVPGASSDRIQELHKVIIHGWCEGIEELLGYRQGS